jgi:ERCC4-related helicase
MIKNFTPRLYQETIFSTCVMRNTLVVIPTGLGKTNIFLMVAAKRINQYPDSKILFVGPTRPLISQYYEVFINNFEIEEKYLAIFTGNVSPAKRKELWKTSKIIFSTPQGIENDILSRRICLDEVSLLGIDEAHRGVGDYSYVWLAKKYEESSKYPRIVGFTASPGSDKEKIQEVCQNLFIEDIEVRSNEDPDVKPYIKEIEIKKIRVDLPESFSKIKKYMEDCFFSKIKEMKALGVIENDISSITKIELLKIQGHLVAEMNQGNKDFSILKSLSLNSEAMKISHGLELLESQGIEPLKEYLDKLKKQAISSKVKAAQNIVKDINFRSASILTDSLYKSKIEHPKVDVLKNIINERIKEQPASKIIVFTQFRDTATVLKNNLNTLPRIESQIFVGQLKKNGTGLSQKEQIKMLDDFRNGMFNTIIMTSVGEEGLDIPSVDLVIFYEPVPSAIRSIQRRGRTGRQDKGNVILLIAKNTRDERYEWSSHHKEKRMYKNLEDIKKGITLYEQKKQPSLNDFENKNYKIIADFREKGSAVLKKLLEMNADLIIEKIEVGDYQISERVGIEFKTTIDFIESLIDGRLLTQLPELKRNYEKPLIIVEGNQDIYSLRNVHPNAIKGMISTILINFGIPILYTKNPKETAEYILSIAKREQEEGKRNFSAHAEKRLLSTKEHQEYIISSFPGIGTIVAKSLLKHFKTIKSIINAEEKELLEVDGIGKTNAKKISDIISQAYKE